jgi:hypothetical protein
MLHKSVYADCVTMNTLIYTDLKELVETERDEGIRFDCCECGDEVGPYDFFWKLTDNNRVCEACMRELKIGPYHEKKRI